MVRISGKGRSTLDGEPPVPSNPLGGCKHRQLGKVIGGDYRSWWNGKGDAGEMTCRGGGKFLSNGSPSRAVMIAVLILSVYGLPQKIKFDYNRSADFAKFKTYAWIKGTPAVNPNLDLYILGAVDHDLRLKGLTKTEAKQADLLVTYHAARDTEVNASGIDDASYAVTMGLPVDSRVWSTNNPSMGTARYIHKGSLAIELFEREHHQLVWMATASLKLKEKKNEALDQLDKVLTKIFDSYPPH
jgi:hypothetical protein